MIRDNWLASRYYNIVVTGLNILYETSLIDPGSIEDLGNFARQILDCAAKRASKFSPRIMDELAKEANPQPRKKRNG